MAISKCSSSVVVFTLFSLQSFVVDTGRVTLSGGCAQQIVSDGSFPGNPSVPANSWILTPRVIDLGSGRYRVLGRAVHMDYVKEQLRRKRLNFGATRTSITLVNQVEILADKLYIKGRIALHGIRLLKIYARTITATSGSRLDVSTPNWNQRYRKRITAGSNGENGKNGLSGPTVEIYTDIVRGTLEVLANGANGHKGQDGGNGASATTRPNPAADRPSTVCTSKTYSYCNDVGGRNGVKGNRGSNGGDAGLPGNGGNAGRVTFRSRQVLGRAKLKTCRGTGAAAARNGAGGAGSAGGLGGRGRDCQGKRVGLYNLECVDDGLSGRGRTGSPGDSGSQGNTPRTPGRHGAVRRSLVQSGRLDSANKHAYPLELLYVIKRQAEDVLLGDPSDSSGREALQFIANVVSGSDATSLKKAAILKLGFLGKRGYDIFGKNKMFAPRIKWQSLRDSAEDIKKAATSYEQAYNSIKTMLETNANFAQIGVKMSAVANLQVEAEKSRLVEAKRIAESEKGLYVRAIQHLETEMRNILTKAETAMGKAYKAAKFNSADLIVVIQGVVGFANAVASKDPFDFIDSALNVAGGLLGKNCLKSLSSYLGSIKKWLTFGKNYTPLKDSSELDFDKLDVSSVPDIMQVNLEMNKETLASELVCLLDVASRPQDVAGLRQHIETFFIAGAARIDLIGKVMDLDNDIGGYNFDIPLLENTKKSITDIGKPVDTPIRRKLQLNFLDYLLSTYREMERSFMRRVYELHKAFKFRTLWEGNDPLAQFRRVAASSAQATGHLNGILQLTDVMKNIEDVETDAVSCFTNNVFSTGTAKWTFDNVKHTAIFQNLATGSTKFTIRISDSCSTCYNIRLLKMYIELTGDQSQPANIPANIHIQIRHLSGSFFRAGDGTVKQYRQPVGSFRSIKFNRFRISDDVRCRKKRSQCPKYCVEQEDYRWEPMCSHPLTKGSCVDRLLGEEECKSPFGTYELKIPVDPNLDCNHAGITNKNCKDLDLTKFTKLNVWVNFFYWPDDYPTGPDDTVCKSPLSKRANVTTPIVLGDGFKEC